MQYEQQKLYLIKTIGHILREIRKNHANLSLNQLANSYEIDKGGLSKIENGLVDCQISTLWKIIEASGLKFSEFAKLLEAELGDDFKLIEE